MFYSPVINKTLEGITKKEVTETSSVGNRYFQLLFAFRNRAVSEDLLKHANKLHECSRK